MITGRGINTTSTESSTPVAVMALGALSLMTAYMSAMSFFNPSNTVFKSQFSIEGDTFNGAMFFAAVLSFAAFVFNIMTREEPKEALPRAIQTQIQVKEKAIYQAARSRVARGKVGWVAISEDETAKIQDTVKRTKKLLKEHVALNDQLDKHAATMATPTTSFDAWNTASGKLTKCATSAVDNALRQDAIKDAVKNALWTENVKMAAGRRMQAISLGVVPNANDVALVDDVNRRAPLLVWELTKQFIAEGSACYLRANDGIENKMAAALKAVPAGQGVNYEANAPLEISTENRGIKETIAEYFWKKDALTAAGNIAAERSVGMRPARADVEKARFADVGSRRALETALTSKSQTIEKIPEMCDSISTEMADASTNHAIYAINEKVKQYVWTSNPAFCYAKARVHSAKASEKDVDDVRAAENLQALLVDKVMELLKAIARERQSSVNTEDNPFGLMPSDVTDALVEKAIKLVRQEQAETRNASRNRAGHP